MMPEAMLPPPSPKINKVELHSDHDKYDKKDAYYYSE